MVSKTRAQRQKKKLALEANGGVAPAAAVPTPRKSIHEKKTRPNMKGKQKVRLGMTSADIYEGFEERSTKGTEWKCPKCEKVCRTVGFCVHCSTMEKQLQGAVAAVVPAAIANPSAKKAATSSAKKKAPAVQRKK